MKSLNILLLGLFVTLNSVIAQSSDSTAEKNQEQQQVQTGQETKKQQQAGQQNQVRKETPAELKGFIDMNANGIDDRLENPPGKGKGKNIQKDRFVDMDGDGICDGKESAIGLKKLYRKRKGNPHR